MSHIGEADHYSAFIEINPGAGGTESCDWADMLCQMYMKWGTLSQHSVEVVERVSGPVAGISSCTISIEGPQVYGWLRNESGGKQTKNKLN